MFLFNFFKKVENIFDTFNNDYLNHIIINSTMEWTDRPSVLAHIDNSIEELNDIVRIAAFDLDDTLLVYRKGKQMSNAILLDDSLPGKIEELINDNYAIVIFSNQSGMSKKTFPLPEWKEKVRKLKKILFKNIQTEYYFAIYAAKTCDMYRKPNVGMWEMMKNDIQELYGLCVTFDDLAMSSHRWDKKKSNAELLAELKAEIVEASKEYRRYLSQQFPAQGGPIGRL